LAVGTQLTGVVMSIVSVIFLLIVVGVVVALVPMDGNIKRIIYILVAVAVVLWLLQLFALLPPLHV
jgi:hypothetical protein